MAPATIFLRRSPWGFRVRDLPPCGKAILFFGARSDFLAPRSDFLARGAIFLRAERFSSARSDFLARGAIFWRRGAIF